MCFAGALVGCPHRGDLHGVFCRCTGGLSSSWVFAWCVLQVHWWAVLIMGIGVVVFMVVFMKVFGYVTPGYNPSLPRGRPTNHHHGRRFVHGAATHAPNVMVSAVQMEFCGL